MSVIPALGDPTMGNTVFAELDEMRSWRGVENISVTLPGKSSADSFKVEIHYQNPGCPCGGRKRFWSDMNIADAVYAAYRWLKDSKEVER